MKMFPLKEELRNERAWNGINIAGAKKKKMRKQKLEWMLPRRNKRKKKYRNMKEGKKERKENWSKTKEKNKGRNTGKTENLAGKVKFIPWR